jgi:FKBP-type peptidyl-prolyl cis-trans isomerase
MPRSPRPLVARASQAARAGQVVNVLTGTLLLCLTALAASGCSKASAAPVPTVSGGFGSDPVISLPAPKPPASLTVKTLSKGSGPVVTPDDYVLFNVAAKVWAGDRLVMDSFTDREPQGLPLSSGLPAWRHLAGQRVGSRVLMVVPPKDGFGPRGNPSVNVTGTDTLVFVFDILQALPTTTHASGTAVPYHPGPRMPAVATTAQGPQITVPSHAKPPAHLVSRVLIRGHGPHAIKGDTVVVQFTGVIWRTGEVFDSSWVHQAPQVFGLGSGQTVRGWELGLQGQRVGSRVLLVIPPKLGFGKRGSPPVIKGTDALVYVVDIIAAVHA